MSSILDRDAKYLVSYPLLRTTIGKDVRDTVIDIIDSLPTKPDYGKFRLDHLRYLCCSSINTIVLDAEFDEVVAALRSFSGVGFAYDADCESDVMAEYMRLYSYLTDIVCTMAYGRKQLDLWSGSYVSKYFR